MRLWSAAAPGLTGDCALRRQADFGAQAKRPLQQSNITQKAPELLRTLFDCGLPQWERPACSD
ncbi:MAG: hypothetical protein MR399_08520 [Clostridiales bacterium]|nr:hypothetical protein [Clostridiales bacterium]